MRYSGGCTAFVLDELTFSFVSLREVRFLPVSIIPSVPRIQSSVMQQMKKWSIKGALQRGRLFTKLLVQDSIEEKEMK